MGNVYKKEDIDWNNKEAKISDHFTVKEATYLPTWDTYHTPSEDEKDNILKMAEKMELVREFLGRPIHVHVWLRPSKLNNPKSHYNGRDYNKAIGGAPKSAHAVGLAVDFHASAYTCDDIRVILLDKLEEFDVRMENHSGNWIHLDVYKPAPGKSRFFRP